MGRRKNKPTYRTRNRRKVKRDKKARVHAMRDHAKHLERMSTPTLSILR